MLDLIEIELTRVRRMAEHADDGFLIYLLDMAILEANRRARFNDKSGIGSADKTQLLEPGNRDSASNLAGELKLVR